MFKAVAPPWADTTRICGKYILISQKYIEKNNNMGYGGGYLWIGSVFLWWGGAST